jgi:N-acetylmuramoyl-L-alanine amidase
MKHRPGLGWLLATLAVCALAAAFVLGAMSVARGAEPKCDAKCDMPTLRPGEFQLLVRMVYAEARSDGIPGMAAAAHVALNRLEDPKRFGRTLRGILTAPNQFAVGPARHESEISWMMAIHAASGAVLGLIPDQTGGAQYFHLAGMNPLPRWAHGFTRVARVGSHIFYRRVVD